MIIPEFLKIIPLVQYNYMVFVLIKMIETVLIISQFKSALITCDVNCALQCWASKFDMGILKNVSFLAQ